jgi:hypothetical protein
MLATPHEPEGTFLLRLDSPLDFFIFLYKITGKGNEMPILSLFYGIVIRMYKEISGKHHKPHIHVEYAEDEAVIALDGEILQGQIPKSKMKLVEAWMEIHHEDLKANWKLLSNGEEYFKIDPLK